MSDWIKDLLPPGDKFKEALMDAQVQEPAKPKMTVKQLLKYILFDGKVPEDATISLEGCDCVDECRGWTYDPSTNTLEMER